MPKAPCFPGQSSSRGVLSAKLSFLMRVYFTRRTSGCSSSRGRAPNTETQEEFVKFISQFNLEGLEGVVSYKHIAHQSIADVQRGELIMAFALMDIVKEGIITVEDVKRCTRDCDDLKEDEVAAIISDVEHVGEL